MRSNGVRCFALLSLGAGALACNGVTSVRLDGELGKRGYAIECVELGACWSEARRTCGGRYRAVSVTHNQIPESELPGLNLRTESHGRRHNAFLSEHPSGVGEYGPGFDSDEPLPFSHVVVICGPAGEPRG